MPMLSNDTYFLMNKNRKVLEFSTLENRFGKVSMTETKREPNEPLPIGYTNISDWLSARCAPKGRKHMSRLMSMCGCSDVSDFVRITHALSLHDTFWVRRAEESLTWEQISLFQNQFDFAVARVAFEGRGGGRIFPSVSPEFTTDGNYPKCWKKYGSRIVLFKQGSDRLCSREVWSEKYAAEVAEKICRRSVDYHVMKYRGQLVSECTLFTSEQIGYVPMRKIARFGTPKEILAYMAAHESEDDFRRMLVLDALVLNTDRHTGNYGMLIDTDTMEIQGMAPVYDHNRSLLPEVSDRWIGEENVASGIFPKIGDDFNETANDMLTPEIEADLKNLHGFKFSRDEEAGLSEARLSAMERIVSTQIDCILGRIRLITPRKKYTAENVSPDSFVGTRTEIGPDARVRDSNIEDRAKVLEHADVCSSTICHEAHVTGHARVMESLIRDSALVTGNVVAMDGATIGGEVVLEGDQILGSDAQVLTMKDVYACGRMEGETVPCGSALLPARLTFYRTAAGSLGFSFQDKKDEEKYISDTAEHLLEYAKTEEEKLAFEAALREAGSKIQIGII